MTTKFISDMGPKSALIAPRPLATFVSGTESVNFELCFMLKASVDLALSLRHEQPRLNIKASLFQSKCRFLWIPHMGK